MKDSKFFIIIFFGISFIFMISCLFNSNDIDVDENRYAKKITIPTINSFMSGEYQKNIETAISDQMYKNEEFNDAYFSIDNTLTIEFLKSTNLYEKNMYKQIIPGLNIYNSYLINGLVRNIDDDDNYNRVTSNINNLIENSKSNFYFYYIETDVHIDYTNNNKIGNTLYFLRNNLNISNNNISVFNINNFNDHSKYFYKNDHHWNHIGSYKGYKEIANLMNFETVLVPTNCICFYNTNYVGSKQIAINDSKYFNENACRYSFDYPDFDIKFNENYIQSLELDDNTISNSKVVTYPGLYGENAGKIIIKNKDNYNNKKLLIISNSFSAPLRKLLASNYSETHVIDLRYFKEDKILNYINNNNFDDVLIIGSWMFFHDYLEW